MEQDMTQGKPLSIILKFTLPLLVGNIFQQFYCNFYKIAQTPEIEHYASWSPIDNPTPNFHLPVFFAKAQIEE